jgi:hypothetical protein
MCILNDSDPLVPRFPTFKLSQQKLHSAVLLY